MPEAGVVGLAQTSGGSVLAEGLESLADDLDVSLVLVGPGLDDADQTARLIADLVPRLGPDCTLALDAYGLGALPSIRRDVEAVAGRLMLTPNSTEARLLLEREPGEAADDIAEIARRYQAVVSGSGFVADPGGGLWRIGAGHSGLATAGSGDVLAGAIAGIASGGAELAQAACWGTYVHAAAGDRLAARIGRVGFLAREICAELPSVLAELGT
jgi:NAD(P)H-hydrate repair Nnr-like enzyme with NAD(P)H-hydrate dehydratase domain